MSSGILIAFGLAWMVVAALIGLFLGAKHQAHVEEMRTTAAQSDLVGFYRTFEAYKWNSSVHAHGMLFSLSVIAIGSILPYTGFTKTASEILVGTLITATIVWTFAGLRRIRPLMGLADLLFIFSIAATAWAVATNALGHA
jgi:hypothetical protein